MRLRYISIILTEFSVAIGREDRGGDVGRFGFDCDSNRATSRFPGSDVAISDQLLSAPAAAVTLEVGKYQ